MKKLYLIIFLLITYLTIAQNEHNANWIFGKSGATINFNSVGPAALNSINANALFGVNPPTLNIVEGSAVVSNSQGQIIFYTDGNRVFDANNNVTPNGIELKGNCSSSQNVIIVPRPNQDYNGYYIATIDGYTGNQSGLHWTEFNTALNGGMGDVVESTKNSPFMYNGFPIEYINSEKITSTNHVNGIDYWIVVQYDKNVILSYLVNNSGISQNPIVSSFATTDAHIGMLKIAPDGSRIVLTGYNGIYLGNFNNSTGQISLTNSISTIYNSADSFYGVEFSPDGQNVYFQMYNLNNINRLYSVQTNNFTFSSINFISDLGTVQFVGAGLQRAIDGRIYVNAGSASNNRISVINNPNNFSNPQFIFDTTTLNFGTRNPRVSFPQLVNKQPSANNCQPITLTTESTPGVFTYLNYKNITTTTNYNINLTSQDITMKASEFIVMKPNSHVKAGSKYLAKIEACNTTLGRQRESSKEESFEEKGNEKDEIVLYPNPSNSLVSVSANQNINEITINSFDGKRVFNQTRLNQKTLELDISSFEKGIYVLILETTDKSVITKKLVKN